MDRRRLYWPQCDLVIENDRIADLQPYDPKRGENFAGEVLDLRGFLLMPGFVQAHVHLCQSLFRNQADHLSLLDWLQQRIWPLENAHDPVSLKASAALGMAEMLLNGTTAILDMGTVRHTEVIFEQAAACGMRMVGGKAHMDAGDALPAGMKEDRQASLDQAEALCRQYHGSAGGRLRYAFAPRFVLSCSDALLSDSAALARQLGARLHTHASENQDECKAVFQRYGRGNVEALADLGLQGPDCVLAHGVWLEPDDGQRLAEAGTHLVHCPSANLKLASGFAPIPELQAQGVSLALGADGAPCNNNLDPWWELRLASLIHLPGRGAQAMPAHSLLEMATLGGARALGLESEIGSLETGKQADLLVLKMQQPWSIPAGPDPAATLVYSGGPRNLEQVWIGGRRVVNRGELLTLDLESVQRQAEEQWSALRERLP